jgi:hypothetical protein
MMGARKHSKTGAQSLGTQRGVCLLLTSPKEEKMHPSHECHCVWQGQMQHKAEEKKPRP